MILSGLEVLSSAGVLYLSSKMLHSGLLGNDGDLDLLLDLFLANLRGQ